MPKLWESNVHEHRDAVRAAIAQATGTLAHRQGVTGLTMSAIARESGISRATLYRYVSDTAEAVDLWRTYQIDQHLHQLQSVAEHTPAERRLQAVMERYVINLQHRHGPVGAVIPHLGAAITDARSTVSTLLRELIIAETVRGTVRTDVPVDELLIYAMTSLEAATQLPSRHAALRLVNLVAQSLRRSAEDGSQARSALNGLP